MEVAANRAMGRATFFARSLALASELATVETAPHFMACACCAAAPAIRDSGGAAVGAARGFERLAAALRPLPSAGPSDG